MSCLRPATLDDGELQALSTLHSECFSRAWSRAEIASVLKSSGCFALIFGSPTAVAGFIIARAVLDEAEVLTLAVSRAHRSRGIGRALLFAAAAQAFGRGAQKLFLEAASTNDAARSLYSSLGFEVVGRRKHYYERRCGSAEDAFTLRVNLPLQEKKLGESSQNR